MDLLTERILQDDIAFSGGLASAWDAPASVAVPRIGLGLWRMDNQGVRDAVLEALKIGYRLFDTAAIHGNEKGLGLAVQEGLERFGLTRRDIFITTKLWNDSHGYDAALYSFERSLTRLGLDYVDMYMIQWPAPARNLYLEAWKALVRLREEGRVMHVGVSNFLPEYIDRLYDESGVKPAFNQIEVHPYFQQSEISEEVLRRGVRVMAWAPLGRGSCISDPLFRKLALKYGKTPAQIVLRWHLDCGRGAVPKSVKASRLRENFEVFDFKLDAEDMRQVALLECCRRLGPDPKIFL